MKRLEVMKRWPKNRWARKKLLRNLGSASGRSNGCGEHIVKKGQRDWYRNSVAKLAIITWTGKTEGSDRSADSDAMRVWADPGAREIGGEGWCEVSLGSVRKIMIQEELWKAKKARKVEVYQMRERRACFGELVQIDGSPYDWFEGRAPECTLLVFIDDATGKLVQLLFVESESFFSYCQAAEDYFTRCGKPNAFYSDKHGIFRVNQPTSGTTDAMTQFGRAMQELHIQIICANTPQAKGRVERANQTLQDRLPKELRLRGISDWEAGNAYLPEFIDDFNRRFAVQPRSSLDLIAPFQVREPGPASLPGRNHGSSRKT